MRRDTWFRHRGSGPELLGENTTESARETENCILCNCAHDGALLGEECIPWSTNDAGTTWGGGRGRVANPFLLLLPSLGIEPEPKCSPTCYQLRKNRPQ